MWNPPDTALPFISSRSAYRQAAIACLLMLGLLLLQGCGSRVDGIAPDGRQASLGTSSDTQRGSDAQPGYRLDTGDQMRITVFDQPELSGEYAVDGTGHISFPLIGQVKASQMTAAELERELISRLAPDYLRDPSISVQILTYRPFYVVGEVRQPGSYAFVNGMTVLNAVALAGGFTYRARENDFYLNRAADDGDVRRLLAAPNTPVLPGDVITVRERYF